MLISVIIPTCNRNDLLSQCLNLLLNNRKTFLIDFEIIVSDDSHTNSTKELISQHYPNVTWIRGPKRGPAANRNNGARFANGEWLIFIDDDCLPNENLLTNYNTAIGSYPAILIFEGKISVDRPQRAFNEESPVNEFGGYLWSCNFAIKKEFLFSINGFDENFPFAAMEDVDLEYRIKKLGAEIVFVKGAEVIHPWRVQKNVYSITLKRFISAAYLVNKHPDLDNNLNYLYHMRIAFNAIKGLFSNALKYKFRGIGSRFTFILLQLFFSFLRLFKLESLINRQYRVS